MMQLSARIGRSLVRLLAVIGLLVMFAGSVSAQGTYLSAAGPVNRGMGGASTAAPIDALGAIYWNPATISGLDCSQLEAGLDLLYSNQSVASSVGPFSGLSQSENGFMPIPNVGWVHHTENPAVTIGL